MKNAKKERKKRTATKNERGEKMLRNREVYDEERITRDENDDD